MPQPLANIRVIDATSAISGPYCSMLLGDMGAEVIKIEEPSEGDLLRKSGPFVGGESTYFLYGNRNKRGMTLNLRESAGRDILLKLVKGADVLVENFRPKVKSRLRIDYPALSSINPRLIYCSISGFGQTGPWAETPGFDQIAQGMSGLMSVTGFSETGPTRVGVAIGDSLCAIFAAYGILGALLEREKSGKGQFIETSLLEALIAVLGFQAAKYFGTGEAPLPQGNDHASLAPYGTYKTLDGYINIAAGTSRMWEELCQQLGVERLLKDDRFMSNPNRVANKEELRRILESRLVTERTDHWVESLGKAGIACGPIYTLSQVFHDPQVLNQKMLLETEHLTAGKISLIGFPVKLSRTPCSISLPPPTLGQHTEEILKELEFSKEEIRALREKRII